MADPSSYQPVPDCNDSALAVSAVERFQALIEQGARPTVEGFVGQYPLLTAAELADIVCIDQADRRSRGDVVPAESYLARFPQLVAEPDAAVDVIYQEYLLSEPAEDSTQAAELVARFPDYSDVLLRQIQLHQALISQVVPSRSQRTTGNSGDRTAVSEPQTPKSGSAERRLREPISRTLIMNDGPLSAEPIIGLPFPTIPGYEILTEVARGGVGVIYKARDLRLERIVAVKMLLAPGLKLDPQRLRFDAEVIAAGRLQHPHIIQVFDVGASDGQPFLVMEFADRGTLAQQFRAIPQPPAKAAELIRVLARAVHFMHQKGIIHRDLKPGNILLTDPDDVTSEGDPWLLHPKIADFGMAKLLAAASGQPVLDDQTRTGDILGTPAYMAPEQAAGDTQAIGPATDVHALGVILYELLTGRPPFQGVNAVDTLQLLRHDEPVRPSRLVRRLPKDLETICLRCLEKRPEQRYASASELASELDSFLAGNAIQARPPGLLRLLTRSARRRPVPVALTLFVLLSLTAGLGGFAWWAHDQSQQQANAIVAALLTADPASVPILIARLRLHPDSARQALADVSPQPELHSPAWLYLTLARLDYEPTLADALAEYVPLARPDEIRMLSRSLAPYLDRVAAQFWQTATDQDSPPRDRLKAACVLAAETVGDPRWPSVGAGIVQPLVRENPVHVARWTQALQPVRHVLISPLREVLLDGNQFSADRLMAAGLLAEWLRDQPEQVARLLMICSPEAYVILFRAARIDEPTLSVLENALTYPADGTALQDMPAEPINSPQVVAALHDTVERARQHAVAAITLARLNENQLPQNVKAFDQLLQPAADPTARSFATSLAAQLQLSPEWIVAQLSSQTSPGILTGLLQMLGEFDKRQFPGSWRENVHSKILQFVQHSDSGVHSSAEWLLQRWELAESSSAQSASPPAAAGIARSRWFTNPNGQTFAVLLPGEFVMGSLRVEEDHEDDELRHARRIDHSFAMATKEVTVQEYLRFRPGAFVSGKYSPRPDSPMVNVTFFDAAAYCRWLSEREGVPETEMCFPAAEQIVSGMQLPADYLARTGYRLPTEAEWEYACRGGTLTSWSFGLASELIDEYAQCTPHSGNAALSVGSLKPNESGLFDMHGNAAEWCVNLHRPYDSEQPFEVGGSVITAEARVIRGGFFGDFRFTVRSARRATQPADQSWAKTGIRLVRTISDPGVGKVH